MTERNAGEPNEEATWPYASLLLLGYFGKSTPEGRRFARWTTAALAVIVVSMPGLIGAGPPVVPRIVPVLVIPAAMAVMGLAYVRYLRALDELARTIQLQAFAIAYLSAMVLWTAVFAAATAWEGDVRAAVASGGWLFLVMLPEAVRGTVLVYLARRYR